MELLRYKFNLVCRAVVVSCVLIEDLGFQQALEGASSYSSVSLLRQKADRFVTKRFGRDFFSIFFFFFFWKRCH